jgi:hypothetical protein
MLNNHGIYLFASIRASSPCEESTANAGMIDKKETIAAAKVFASILSSITI